MSRYSPEDQRFTGTWENIAIDPGENVSEELEGSLWSRRSRSEYPQDDGQTNRFRCVDQSEIPNEISHQQRKRKRSEDLSGMAPKSSKQTPPSSSDWKYNELLRDNLTMALVDELHKDGHLLRETWPEIETRLANMVTDRLLSVPHGPNPFFDSSLVIRGHRVIRCVDGFSKIFLEDCVATIGDAWHGLRIKLVHASQIPCQGDEAAGQAHQSTEETEENSFGWILPRGAQLSHIAIGKIQERQLNKRKGNSSAFLLEDGSKTWRVRLGRGLRVRITEHSPPAEKMNQSQEEEELTEAINHAVDLRGTEPISPLEIAELMDEIEQVLATEESIGRPIDVEQALQTEEIEQEVRAVESEQEVENSLGWIVPLGAELPETVILQIQNRLLKKPHGKRYRCRLDDGSKTWRVTIGHSNHVGLRQNEQNKNTEKGKDKTQYNPGAEEITQAEQPNQAEAMNQSDEIDESEQLAKKVKVELTDEIAPSVRNSFGWILPLGAKLSDATVLEIQGRVLSMPVGERRWFLHRDGSKTWRITVGPDHRIRITEHTPPHTDVMNPSKEEQEQTEEINHQKDEAVKSVQIAQTEKMDTAQTGKIKRIDQKDDINQTNEMKKAEDKEQMPKMEQRVNNELTEVMEQPNNLKHPVEQSFHWILLHAAQLTDTASLEIQKRLLNRTKGDSHQFVVRDGPKSWKVTVYGGYQVRIAQLSEDANQTEKLEETEENSFGWTLPQGAELSETAIMEIQNRLLHKPNGKRYKFILTDEPKTWSVTLGGGYMVLIAQQQENMEQVEVKEQEESAKQTKDTEQPEEIEQTKKTEKTENSLGWSLLGGVNPSETAIQQIKSRLLKRKSRKRYRFLIKDGTIALRVSFMGQRVLIAKYYPSGGTRQHMEDTEQTVINEKKE
ncbi:uncharacterized protein LOC108148970 [Drosophila elegans]|uniref:uncharacterized protein LOC108148970 n=1 Tax=Drosophila elegans TaxID=30023 RepID=UPI0007E85861|nr:uncharacterized protein LOC108148970 [Drosophila elegans]